ncbi:yemanuclein [Calliphora vicina]|uniref:yemanuclein n=1 Tax=Calliphora vicina TaxID=7373 RepID=UPI00325A797D
MTEAKRVTLTTISSTVSSSLMTAGSSNPSRFGADFLAQTEKPTTGTTSSAAAKGSTKTIRLNVELFQTDSSKYPEFNYAKLLHLEKKKLKKLKQKSNGYSDPFEDNDDDVARIAKELEKKYGNTYSSGRGKNKRDDVDIGMGYDESDSFIDNTEAYDELIPDEVETIEGGFYINCGALEFKKLHTESYTTKTDEIIKMPNRPKKRVISSSSEDSSSSGDDDEDDDDDSEDDDDDETSVETSKSKSSASTSDKKSKPSTATTSNPAKKKPVAPENGGPAKKNKEKSLTSGLSCSASSSPKIPAEERASDVERNAKKVEKTTTVKDMLKAQRDNFLKSQTTSSNGEGKGNSSAEDDDDSSSDDSEDDDDEEGESDDNSDSNQSATQASKDKKQASGTEDQGNEKLRTSDTNLPEMESDVLTSIIEFRDGAKSQNLIGKKFQFDDKLSENFLKIDDSLLCIDKAQRNMVFAHLEFHLSLPKYFFLRKAKQLRIKEEKLKSKRSFNKLHKAITETMSAVTASYEAELRRYSELLASNTNAEQPPKMPKKKFPWNTNLRNLLYDVYQGRWTSYPVLGTRKETLEDFITNYMREKVVEIWPKGWMRYEELQKEIEKRKTAAKKAKEKKKIASATTSGQSSPNPNVSNNPLTSIQIASVSSLAGATTTTGLPNATSTTATAQPVSYLKQFEDFARSNANSDTDSVASSSTSSTLKRKNPDATRNKPMKPKTAKLNGDQTKSINNGSNNNKNAPPTISVDLVSPSKRTDHSINHIMSPTEGSAATTSTASSIFSATTAAVSQPSKHSTSTHVIDLDNYKSVGDILQTSKQIQAAANAATSLLTTVSRRESSGDSEIEIVGVFPAKQQNKKLKVNNRSAASNSNYNFNTEKTSTSSSHHHHNNSNNRKKGGGNSGLTNLPVMDVNKMVNTLMELGDELQIKPILTSTAQQKTQSSSSSTQMSQGPGSHQ